jgi:hypothetical protein
MSGLHWVQVRQRFAEARNRWVHTSGSWGGPHAVPVWGVVLALVLALVGRTVATFVRKHRERV